MSLAIHPRPTAMVTNGGFSPARLSRVADAMQRHVDSGRLPGCSWAICRHGHTLTGSAGTLAAGGSGGSVAEDSIFRISSMTKPVTAVATLILVEDGTLRLDDPVDVLLPELADRRVLKSLSSDLDDTVPAHRPITVRDLLTFRLGFGMIFAPPGLYPIQAATEDALGPQGPPRPSTMPAPDKWMAGLGTLPLMYQPAERWLYNTGSQVLSVLVARAAGQSYPDFLRERIFEPLGMGDTGFSVPAGDLGRFATSYFTNFETGGVSVFDEPDGQWSQPPAFSDGAAGLVSTASDFLAFGRMLLEGGRAAGGRILARPTVETMRTDQITPEQKAVSDSMPDLWEAHGWGFGVAVINRRVDPFGPVGAFGWDGGMGSTFQVDPQEDLVTVLLTQQAFSSAGVQDYCADFLGAVYQALDD